MRNTFTELRAQFEQEAFPSIKTRRARLKSIRDLLDEYTERLCQVISEDFGYRSHHETKLTEIYPILNQLNFTLEHLPLWLQEEHRPIDLFFQSAKAKVIHVPLGVVGIVTPWNFPLLLAFSPLITALAAGNLVMVKMSEYSPRTTRVLQEAIDKHLGGCVKVFAGTSEANKEFAQVPFDHLFFTGSPKVGSLVMQAAARNLTPVTLELGGKCPVFAAPDADFEKLSRKIVWGKSLNAGQICVAPDYLLCPEEKLQFLIDRMTALFQTSFPNGVNDGGYTSIANDYQFERLQTLLQDAQAHGTIVIPLASPGIDIARRVMAPHLIINPPDSSALLHEEIFGPLLPILTYGDFSETKKFLKLNPNPLAIYLFTKDKKLVADFQHNTFSGGLCINDVVVHFSQEHLPVGGVRNSGLGQYHGVEGFLTFTRPKSVFIRHGFSFLSLAYPPYKEKFLKFFYWLVGIKG
jgi:coniferyl-aldehyde dehydrogenase